MSCLHVISKSPANGLLESCQPLLRADDGILFIEDAIYYCNDSSIEKIPDEVSISVLKDDCIARGIRTPSNDRIDIADYPGFVDLCCKYDKVVSWF